MTTDERQSSAPVCPDSPIGHHSDHDSELTVDSAAADENFIALLQFKDAYHVLNLAVSSDPISPETIQNAYDSVKEQVLSSLEECEEEKQIGMRSMTLVSKQNFLELKLQALDQAYKELMPIEDSEGGQQQVDQDERAEVEEGGIVDGSRRCTTDEPIENGLDEGARLSVEKSAPAATANPQHQRVPSDDEELDTIDIYFQPPTTKSHHTRRAKSPDHPSDVSAVTWDSFAESSIFSLVSKTMQNIEEASEGGLSDILGSVPAIVGPDKQQETETVAIDQNRERGNDDHFRRPPSGINVKGLGGPRAQISPTSVGDVSIHNHNHYDNSSSFRNHKTVVGRGKMMRKSRSAASAHHRNTEAARMGILRALSEDNSECLPLDGRDVRDYLNTTNETGGTDDAKFINKRDRTIGTGTQAKGRLFQGKSDSMRKDSNSLMESVLNDKQSQLSSANQSGRSSSTDHERGRSATPRHNNSRPSSPRGSLPSSTSSSRSRSRQRKGDTTTKTNKYSGEIYQSGESTYDAILQSGMELADELCMALNSCCKGNICNTIELSHTLTRAGSAAFDAAASEFDRPLKDEDSIIDDSTYQRSVYTDGESTAFNTMSSFSRRADSPKMISNRKKVSRSSSPNTTTSSDPPPRMLV